MLLPIPQVRFLWMSQVNQSVQRHCSALVVEASSKIVLFLVDEIEVATTPLTTCNNLSTCVYVDIFLYAQLSEIGIGACGVLESLLTCYLSFFINPLSTTGTQWSRRFFIGTALSLFWMLLWSVFSYLWRTSVVLLILFMVLFSNNWHYINSSLIVAL